MNDKPPLTATVALVEFDQGPGLRIAFEDLEPYKDSSEEVKSED